MAIRDTDFYVEQFLIEQDSNGFRSARAKLLEAMLIEISFAMKMEQPEDMDGVVGIIRKVKKQFNAICQKIPEMMDRQKDYDILVQKYDEATFNHWKHKTMGEN